MNHGVVHFEITAADPEKLSRFYSQLFDWQLQKTDMGGGMSYWAIMAVPSDERGMPREPGAINGGLVARQDPRQRSVYYVNVESVEQYLQKARELGASVILPRSPVPGMGFYAVLEDPDGNQVGLWQTDSSA